MNRLLFTIILSAFAICKSWGADTRENIVQTNTVSATISFSYSNPYEWEWDNTTGRLRSTNYWKDNTTSQTTISISTPRDCSFLFDYAISSESRYDKLTITLDGENIVNEISGSISEEYTGTLTTGNHIMVLKYVKDSSQSKNDDRAYISNIRLEKEESLETPEEESAETIEHEGITYRINRDVLSIVNGNSVEGDLVIPSSITYGNTTYSVTGIDSEAFCDKQGLTSVVIPNSITEIADMAFTDCHNLREVTLSNNLSCIKYAAFQSCI